MEPGIFVIARIMRISRSPRWNWIRDVQSQFERWRWINWKSSSRTGRVHLERAALIDKWQYPLRTNSRDIESTERLHRERLSNIDFHQPLALAAFPEFFMPAINLPIKLISIDLFSARTAQVETARVLNMNLREKGINYAWWSSMEYFPRLTRTPR